MSKKILIIDDDPVVVKLLHSRLTENGFAVLAAGDGIAGLKQAKKEEPDLIIADYLMPRMDGFAFYKELKHDPTIANIPVLILTERAQMEDSFRALGIEVFLTKPFMMEGLLSKIRQLLGIEETAEPEEEPRRQSFKKVLVCGTVRYVVQDMVLQLQGVGCKTQMATLGMEAVTRALEFDPDIIVLDVAMGDVPAHKVVTILRQMPRMLNKVILVYHYFPNEGVETLSPLENMGSEDYKSSVCMAAGATEFLGRFNPTDFLQLVQRYLFPGQ